MLYRFKTTRDVVLNNTLLRRRLQPPKVGVPKLVCFMNKVRDVCVIPKVVQILVVCSLPDHVWIEAPSWQSVWNQVDMMDDEELLELVELETREMSWTQFEWDMRLQLYTHAATRSFVYVYDVTGIVQGWASMASLAMTPHSSKEHGTSPQKAIRIALRCSPNPSVSCASNFNIIQLNRTCRICFASTWGYEEQSRNQEGPPSQ